MKRGRPGRLLSGSKGIENIRNPRADSRNTRGNRPSVRNVHIGLDNELNGSARSLAGNNSLLHSNFPLFEYHVEIRGAYVANPRSNIDNIGGQYPLNRPLKAGVDRRLNKASSFDRRHIRNVSAVPDRGIQMVEQNIPGRVGNTVLGNDGRHIGINVHLGVINVGIFHVGKLLNSLNYPELNRNSRNMRRSNEGANYRNKVLRRNLAADDEHPGKTDRITSGRRTKGIKRLR